MIGDGGGGDGDGGHAAAAAAGTAGDEEMDAPSRRAYIKRVIAPNGEANGRRTWLLVGPLQNPVELSKFVSDALLAAAPRWSGREVLARAVGPLVTRKFYRASADTYESLQLVDRSPQLPEDKGTEEPSWWGLLGLGRDLSVVGCQRVIARAKAAVFNAKKDGSARVQRGDVIILSPGDGRNHPWSRYDIELDHKRLFESAATKLATAAGFEGLPVPRKWQVVAAAPAMAFRDIRRKTEPTTPPTSTDEDAGEGDGGRGGRKKRRRRRRRKMPGGQTAPRMLPTDDQVRSVIRGAVYQPGATPHALLKLDPSGSVRVWHYVVGTASAGTRWYALSNVTHKRLAAPYHQRQHFSSGVGRSSTAPVEGGGTAGQRGQGDIAAAALDVEVPLAHEGSGAVAVEGGGSSRAVAVEVRGVDGRGGNGAAAVNDIGALGQDSSGAAAAVASVADTDAAAELRARFYITRNTYLENSSSGAAGVKPCSTAGKTTGRAGRGGARDGFVRERGRELVVAVEFDPVFSRRRAFREETRPAAIETIRASPTVLTLAGDGGPVRRTSTTVFTLTASSTLFRKGRTALIPVWYLLGGEQAMHLAVGGRLADLVRGALQADYMVPVRRAPKAVEPPVPAVPVACPAPSTVACPMPVVPSHAPIPSASASAPPPPPPAPPPPSVTTAPPDVTTADAKGSFWSMAAVRFLFLLRLCGDSSMVSHFLTLTGSSDLNRCPYRWPCMPASYLSLSL